MVGVDATEVLWLCDLSQVGNKRVTVTAKAESDGNIQMVQALLDGGAFP